MLGVGLVTVKVNGPPVGGPLGTSTATSSDPTPVNTGVVIVIELDVVEVIVAVIPPIVTFVAELKFVPLITVESPPTTEPVLGEIEVNEGTGFPGPAGGAALIDV
jgi:hypothetical protein